jgi:hypothetical protein
MDFPLYSVNCSTDCIEIQYGRHAESHFEIYKLQMEVEYFWSVM